MSKLQSSRGQAFKCALGSILFRCPTTRPYARRYQRRFADAARHFELLCMGFAPNAHQFIERERKSAPLQPFLQTGLGVLAGLQRVGLRKLLAVQTEDDTLRSFEAAIEIDCTDHGLDRIGQNRWAMFATAPEFALAETQIGAEIQIDGNSMQALLAHEIGTQARHFSLADVAEAFEERNGNDAIENRVPEEFEALVVRRSGAAVGQCLREQVRAREAIS